MSMQRREMLRTAAASVLSSAALALLPRTAHAEWAQQAWQRLARQEQPATAQHGRDLLTATQRTTLSALADIIIPRTDSPGALDVGVLAWIDVVMADYYSADERSALASGLDAIDTLAQMRATQPFAALRDDSLIGVMSALDAPSDRAIPAVRGYQRVKGLVVHGYFTSERVQKEILRNEIMPGRFVGDAPVAVRGSGGRDA
jgi:hypothetical protein